jgi:hypothetical protein
MITARSTKIVCWTGVAALAGFFAVPSVSIFFKGSWFMTASEKLVFAGQLLLTTLYAVFPLLVLAVVCQTKLRPHGNPPSLVLLSTFLLSGLAGIVFGGHYVAKWIVFNPGPTGQALSTGFMPIYLTIILVIGLGVGAVVGALFRTRNREKSSNQASETIAPPGGAQPQR